MEHNFIIPYTYNQTKNSNYNKEISLKSDLNSKEKLILLYFSDLINIGWKREKLNYCYPSIDTISNVLGCCRKTTTRTLKKLKNKRYISIKPNPGRNSNYYLYSPKNREKSKSYGRDILSSTVKKYGNGKNVPTVKKYSMNIFPVYNSNGSLETGSLIYSVIDTLHVHNFTVNLYSRDILSLPSSNFSHKKNPGNSVVEDTHTQNSNQSLQDSYKNLKNLRNINKYTSPLTLGPGESRVKEKEKEKNNSVREGNQGNSFRKFSRFVNYKKFPNLCEYDKLDLSSYKVTYVIYYYTAINYDYKTKKSNIYYKKILIQIGAELFDIDDYIEYTKSFSKSIKYPTSFKKSFMDKVIKKDYNTLWKYCIGFKSFHQREYVDKVVSEREKELQREKEQYNTGYKKWETLFKSNRTSSKSNLEYYLEHISRFRKTNARMFDIISKEINTIIQTQKEKHNINIHQTDVVKLLYDNICKYQMESITDDILN